MHHCQLKSDGLLDPAAYATEVGELAERLGVRVVLPVTDQSMEALLAHQAAWPVNVLVPGPDLTTYRTASNKHALLKLAADAGFDIPETRVLASREDTLPEDFFPAVLKPHHSVVSLKGTHHKLAVSFVDTVDACRQALKVIPDEGFPVLLQRRIYGSGEGLFVLRWGGRAIAVFAHRRLREKPPAGGVSVYRESIAPAPDLVDPGLKLLQDLNWNGVAMIECKRNRSSGRPVIMEVNGRLWGSLQLAIDAGVDFPSLLVRCAAGLPSGGP